MSFHNPATLRLITANRMQTPAFFIVHRRFFLEPRPAGQRTTSKGEISVPEDLREFASGWNPSNRRSAESTVPKVRGWHATARHRRGDWTGQSGSEGLSARCGNKSVQEEV